MEISKDCENLIRWIDDGVNKRQCIYDIYPVDCITECTHFKPKAKKETSPKNKEGREALKEKGQTYERHGVHSKN